MSRQHLLHFGKHAEAEREVLGMRTGTLGLLEEEHPHTLTSTGNLGSGAATDAKEPHATCDTSRVAEWLDQDTT